MLPNYISALPFTIINVPDLGTWHVMLLAEIARTPGSDDDVFALFNPVEQAEKTVRRKVETLYGKSYHIEGICLLEPHIKVVTASFKPTTDAARDFAHEYQHEIGFATQDRIIKAARYFVTEHNDRLQSMKGNLLVQFHRVNPA